MSEPISRLFKIDVQDNAGPYDLFKQWFNEAMNDGNSSLANVMNIATVSKSGNVSNRSVLLKELTDDGFMFNTTRRSQKHDDIQNHPQVSLCFVWSTIINGEQRSRQVRIEGVAKEMPEEFTRQCYRRWSMRTKIRFDFCKQGNEIDWNELKQRHDKYLRDLETLQGHTSVNKGEDEDIHLPIDTVYYTVVPHRVEYYESVQDAISIADRVLFRLHDKEWNFVHLEA